ncbi:MAG: polymer-forming cytoskeletal protein [Lachnospiraceae bacterium]|nr:polymer-forming cytoskeletal protein [Lachnospiraceae bacterium]MDE7184510.1 polymer-forming cytoskeletal protein [Lachnospiraceae bacterium]
MGFFQDLKQDLSQTVNGLEPEDAVAELNLEEAEAAASEDLFGTSREDDLAKLDAMLEQEVAEYGDVSVKPVSLQENPVHRDNNDTMAEQFKTNVVEMPVAEENSNREADEEMEELLNEVEQNIQEPAYMDETPAAEARDNTDASVAASTDTAVITAGMNITGDATSTGNMDLIGSITGNIEILGKLNVTGSITGNSSAAEIYAESAQINGEIKSKGSVKIGQSSVVIGNIFATSAVIAGAVKGDIDVHGPVILDTSAIVMGNIKSKSVQINNGAVIEGMCSQCYADLSPTAFFNDVKKNRKQQS